MEEAIAASRVVTAQRVGIPDTGSCVLVDGADQATSKSVSLADAVSKPVVSAPSVQSVGNSPRDTAAVPPPVEVKDLGGLEEVVTVVAPDDKAGVPVGVEGGGHPESVPHVPAQTIVEPKEQAASAGRDDAIAPLDPGKYEALYRSGVQLKKVGRFKDAIRTLEQAAQHSDYWLKAYAQVALCFREAGRSSDALSAFRKALTKAGTTPSSDLRVRYELGKTLQALGKRAEAVEQFRLIVRAESGYRDVAERLNRLGAGAVSGSSKRAREVPDSSWVSRAWGGLQGLFRRSHEPLS
jgi:hypothetical protein